MNRSTRFPTRLLSGIVTTAVVGAAVIAGSSTLAMAAPPPLQSVAPPAHAPAVAEPFVERIGGADRYAVSAAVSAHTFDPGVPVAYIASGEGFADALSASPAAGAEGGGVLLVQKNAIPAPVATELRRLKPQRIVVLGGPAAIAPGVETSLRAFSGTVTRISGVDRYAVSAAVSSTVFGSHRPVAYVASGETFPDALSGSAAAGRLGGPVLLVTRDQVPTVVADELRRLAPAKIVVLGGREVISQTVVDGLSAAATTSRIDGADRFVVSAAVSANTFPPSIPTVYVASGTGFADALSGGPAAIANSGPVLLVTPGGVPDPVKVELDRLHPRHIVVLGGTAAVSDATLEELRGFLRH